MTMKKKKLPIGIENFEELQKEEFYYVDKTNLIRDLLMQWSKVNLFTRPRRFGKSLNMSMLKYFFEPGGDKEIFKKLAISGETEICEKYMGKFPVVSISLKGINGESYEKACAMAVQVIQSEARRFQYLLESERLTAYEKKVFASLLQADMGEDLLCSSLKIMSELLEKHHGCKVILLIDEYDVPLAKAFERGYYDQMVIFIRNMFEYALKTNDSLKADPDAQPRNYWLNTSSNEAVRRFIRESDHAATRREIENLVAGEAITKEIHQELTYKDMYDSIDNLWSVLFTTGYLTQRGKPDGDNFRLVIPNVEIRKIFTSQIMELFKESVPKNGEALRNFCQALRNGDAKSVERLLGEYLRKTISIRDTFVKRQMKENFYHGILIGILGFADTWSVSSNKESGDGYSDILVETDDGETGIILELKYAEDGKLDESCREALRQINLRRYEEELLDEGVEHILKYGIAFYKKRCRVMLADVDTDH